jgi:hypothetical protein
VRQSGERNRCAAFLIAIELDRPFSFLNAALWRVINGGFCVVTRVPRFADPLEVELLGKRAKAESCRETASRSQCWRSSVGRAADL